MCRIFEQLQEVGDGLVKSLHDFAGLEKGLLFVAGHRVSELFSFIWTLFTKRHLQDKLKFAPIESQDLFCKFLAHTWAHTFEKFSGACRQKCSADTSSLARTFRLFRVFGIRLAHDLLFYKHFINLSLVVRDCSNLKRLWVICISARSWSIYSSIQAMALYGY